MTAAARNRQVAPPGESSVYMGSIHVGDIVPRRGGGFTAKLANGRRLPRAFKAERLAMAAILAAVRGERPPLSTNSERT